jgi:hypothetical protein
MRLIWHICFREALNQIDGVEVFAFTDPLLALEHFKANHQNYRVVISDYRMTNIKFKMSYFENTSCVDKFLQKPVSMTELIKEIQMLVSKMQIAETNRLS